MELPLTEALISTRTEHKSIGKNYIYLALRRLFRISTKVYFSRISIHNLQAVPKNVPLILISNHPSAFMDPILLGILMPQECIFLARGEAFKKKLGSMMMHKMNALPVYREDVSPEKIHLNRDTFRKSFQLLDQGKTLFFFPEGVSQTEPRLRPLKKGLARLVFNYAEENNWQQEVFLLPVGLSYTDPHSFRSKVTIHFGEPVNLMSWKDQYIENKAKAINSFTEWSRQQLEKLTVFIPEEKHEILARNAEKLLGYWEVDNTALILEKLKIVTSKMQQLKEEQPEEAAFIENEIAKYFDTLNNLGVKNEDLATAENHSFAIDILLFLTGFLLGAPLFIYGALNHIFPYLLAGFVTKKMTPRPDFTGSLRLASGTFATVIFYLLQTVFVGLLTASLPFALIYLFSLPLSGYFCIWFVDWFSNISRRLKMHYFKNSFKQEYANLQNIRNVLTDNMMYPG